MLSFTRESTPLRAIVLLAFGAALTVGLPASSAQTPAAGDRFPDALERAGAWPYGISHAVEIDPDRSLIFLGSGGVVLTLDAADPTQPSLVSEDIHTKGVVADLFYDTGDSLLYAACGVGGLEIWDVGDPSSPVRLSSLEVLYFDVETPVGNVDVYGDYAVVECNFGYVHTIDVSDPANPFQVAFNGQMGNPAADIYVDATGTVHATGAQFYVRLILNPDGTLSSAGLKDFSPYGASDVWGNDEVAYVDFSGSLYILDLLLPGFPAWSITDMGGIDDFAVHDNHVFVVNDDGLQIWDASVYNNPVFVASLPGVPAHPERIVVGDGYAYVTNRQDGLSIIDISTLSAPVEIGTYDVLSIAWETELAGRHAYVAHSDDGLLVLDLMNLERPVLVGQVDTEAEARDVKLSGDYAYVAASFDGLRICDISAPEAPFEAAVYDSFRTWRVEVQDDVAYAVEAIPNQPYVIHALDISDPLAPFELDTITMPEIIWELAASGDYLYVATFASGMRVVDISDPTNLTHVNTIFLPDVFDLDIDDERLYVVASDPYDGGVYVYDLANPLNPTLLGAYRETGFAPYHISGDGSYAYVLDSDEVHLLDVSDPSSMQILDSYMVPGILPAEVNARSSYAFISAGDAGVQIVWNTLAPSGVDDDLGAGARRGQIALSPSVPNPIDNATTIHFWLAEPTRVELAVYDAGGSLVKRLAAGRLASGHHSIRWEGEDEFDKPVSSGVYFYRLEASDQSQSRKMLLIQ